MKHLRLAVIILLLVMNLACAFAAAPPARFEKPEDLWQGLMQSGRRRPFWT
jgi:hypothetical protein